MSAFPWAPGLPYSADILGHNLSNPTIVNEYMAANGGQLPTLEGVYYSGFAVAVDAYLAGEQSLECCNQRGAEDPHIPDFHGTHEFQSRRAVGAI